MSDYPTDLVRTRHLFDGTVVTVRPIRPQDASMEQDFIRNLSADSRYKRFMATLKELPEADLRYFTDIDYERHLALVAIVSDKDRELEIGVARYVVGKDPRSCEFAITIADEWQRSGVAGILMASLMDAARGRGLTTMEGTVLATNHQMRKFVRQLGFSEHAIPDEPDMVRVARTL